MGNICNSQERDVQKDHSNQLQVIMILIYKWAKKKANYKIFTKNGKCVFEKLPQKGK